MPRKLTSNKNSAAVATVIDQIDTLLEPQVHLGRVEVIDGGRAQSYPKSEAVSYWGLIEGKIVLEAAGRVIELKASDFVLVPPGVDVNVLNVTGEYPASMVIGRVSFAFNDERLLALVLPDVLQFTDGDTIGLLSLTGADVPTVPEEPFEALLGHVFRDALRQQVMIPGPAGLYRALADDGLANVLAEIVTNPEAIGTTARLARMLNLSRGFFSKRFMTAMGMPPWAFVVFWRMAIVRRALHTDPVDFEAIYRRTGYGADPLRKVFRSYHGRTLKSCLQVRSA